MTSASPVYGLIAEFADERKLVDAARRARAEGYRNIDAYAPFSVEGLSEALGFRKDRVALITLLGGIIGGAGVYFLQWYTAVIDYPINAGGRPLHSWPAFIPATFEMTVLGAALAAFFGMLILNGLPRLNHPIFNAPDFDLASRNRFFLCVEAADPRFDAERTRRFLDELDPLKVGEVPGQS
jgi:ActD protein